MSDRPFVKICGLLPGDDLAFTKDSWITHVGFVMVPSSRRFVTPRAVLGMVEQVRDQVQTVGVFSNADLESVQEAVRIAHLDVAQLHGSESVELCGSLQDAGCKVWKAIPVPLRNPDVKSILQACARYMPVVDAILLDAKPPKDAGGGVTGGHGVAFDWTILSDICTALDGFPLWVAGGIAPENVDTLFRTCKPYGIDLSSGVETDGRKDAKRIAQLIKAVASIEYAE
ncbi:N-(5'-phosphoribosyl)anthranilate isomerase [Alicyclobacillus hesperidum]|uniref:N-(5'-phosphoribosyl)anthranilate isomerase n=1 Tax=Alicyclobacillus hesperidum TaxID=89784 RepID=A0AA37UD04_9BACL|nr:phosphoribosylanthranilate isomerase [Alicyclobacillus hesperidum]GLV12599.1 N-(5'-phosphoribosyl)anthranilate isomerase [Alicyclobacillus hesperidum]